MYPKRLGCLNLQREFSVKLASLQSIWCGMTIIRPWNPKNDHLEMLKICKKNRTNTSQVCKSCMKNSLSSPYLREAHAVTAIFSLPFCPTSPIYPTMPFQRFDRHLSAGQRFCTCQHGDHDMTMVMKAKEEL